MSSGEGEASEGREGGRGERDTRRGGENVGSKDTREVRSYLQ